jgi:hypothetical protein
VEIFAAQCAALASLTPVANGKIFNQKSNYLSPVSLTPVANLPPESTTPSVPGAKFAFGVVDTRGAP